MMILDDFITDDILTNIAKDAIEAFDQNPYENYVRFNLLDDLSKPLIITLSRPEIEVYQQITEPVLQHMFFVSLVAIQIFDTSEVACILEKCFTSVKELGKTEYLAEIVGKFQSIY